MKITVISTLPPWKGISKYTEPFVKELAKRTTIDFLGFKSLYPKFIYPGDPMDRSAATPQIENVNHRPLLAWYNPFSWIYAGLTIKGDIVHAQWWSYVLAPIYITVLFLVKYIKRKKILLTVHNVEPHEKTWAKNWLNKSPYFFADHFIVHTQQSKQKLTKKYNISENKITVIPHGVLLPSVGLKNIKKEKARERLKLPSNKKILLYFGTIRDYKGLDNLLEALGEIKKNIDNVLLVIAGKPWEDWQKYQKIINELNLGNYIHEDLEFIPEEDIEYYFKASDLVVLPYKYFDAQSGVGPLTLPFGVPLLVTNTGGLPELVKDKMALANPDDSGDLANKLINILEKPELLVKLKKDIKNIKEKYEWENISQRTVETYQLLNKKE